MRELPPDSTARLRPAPGSGAAEAVQTAQAVQTIKTAATAETAAPTIHAARVVIEPMQASDIDAVLDIENRSQPSPWPAKLFLDELTRDWAYIDVVRAYDAAGAAHLIAFCNYWLVRDEVHLLNLATHPAWRRRGMATLLMDHLITFARREQCRLVTLEVRDSNAPAQALYHGYGFQDVGVRTRYYAENDEDALVMTLELTGGGPDPAATR